MLGLDIGLACAMVSVCAAECTHAHVRGALVVMRQMKAAFGIALGSMAGVVSIHW